MWYVYIVQSEANPGKFYTGFTGNLKRRIKEHTSENAKSHTAKYRPWNLHCYMAFKDKKAAEAFEAYLKTQAGRRFQKLRLQTIL